MVQRAGLRGVNTRAVAAEAGVALGTIYRHVPDLEVLLASAAERVQQRFVDAMEEAVPDGTPLIEAMPRLVDAIVREARAEPRLAELLSLPPTPGSTDGAAIRGWIARRVEQEIPGGEVVLDPELVAAAGFGLVRGVLESVVPSEREVDWTDVSAVIRVGLTGLLSAP